MLDGSVSNPEKNEHTRAMSVAFPCEGAKGSAPGTTGVALSTSPRLVKGEVPVGSCCGFSAEDCGPATTCPWNVCNLRQKLAERHVEKDLK